MGSKQNLKTKQLPFTISLTKRILYSLFFLISGLGNSSVLKAKVSRINLY